MADEIKVGDWISYSVSGLDDWGKVIHDDGEAYTILVKGQEEGGQRAVVGKDGVKKRPPPKGRE